MDKKPMKPSKGKDRPSTKDSKTKTKGKTKTKTKAKSKSKTKSKLSTATRSAMKDYPLRMQNIDIGVFDPMPGY